MITDPKEPKHLTGTESSKADAIALAGERGHGRATTAGFPGHKYGCRIFAEDGWLVGRGKTWQEAMEDIDKDPCS